jgi:hypothetical protein
MKNDLKVELVYQQELQKENQIKEKNKRIKELQSHINQLLVKVAL